MSVTILLRRLRVCLGNSNGSYRASTLSTMAIKVEIISRETIRASSPTPGHLKSYSLSILDQFRPAIYNPLVLFYTGIGPGVDATVSHRLKSSLSDTLTHLYPFTGRIRDNIRIECNDDGVEFVEARISGDTSLVDFLAQPDLDVLTQFLPVDMMSSEAYTGCLVKVQATFFESGGMAIGVSTSHKLADGTTMATFVKTWAQFARDGPTDLAPLEFMVASVFPPSEMLTSYKRPMEAREENARTKRYIFDSAMIDVLRVKSTSETVLGPTRVEAVSAMLWKCKMNAMKSAKEPMKCSVAFQCVNLRKRINPPLPENSIGNVQGRYAVRADPTDEEDLPSLVAKMRKGFEKYQRDYISKLCGPDSFSMIYKDYVEIMEDAAKDSFDLFIMTSICRARLYEADFGWGKPDWTSRCSMAIKNVSVLMDTQDGKGIEAWITLPEREMERFEHEHNLLISSFLQERTPLSSLREFPER